MAKPGAFCDAMVTRKNGIPTLINSAGVNSGAIQEGATTLKPICDVVTSPLNPATALPVSRAATTAKRGSQALHSNHTASILPHNSRLACRLAKACMPKRSNMPASIAAASEWGIIFISRANMPVMPQSTIKALAKIKTPTAWESVTPCRPLTSSAAPGVDQAVRMGTFRQTVRARVLMPIPRPKAVIQPAICAASAPAAAAACQIMAAELA